MSGRRPWQHQAIESVLVLSRRVGDLRYGEQVFCEAAAEWDHDWQHGEDGIERCSECRVTATTKGALP